MVYIFVVYNMFAHQGFNNFWRSLINLCYYLIQQNAIKTCWEYQCKQRGFDFFCKRIESSLRLENLFIVLILPKSLIRSANWMSEFIELQLVCMLDGRLLEIYIASIEY